MQMKDMMIDENETVLENASVVAVCVVKGLHKIPFKKSDGRVAFIVKGDVAGALNCIYENEPIRINDYLKALASVRNAIFTLKCLK
jgi:hypothetical protein